MKYPLVRQWLMDQAGLEPSLLEGPGFESLVALRLLSTQSMNEAMYVAILGHTPAEVDQLTAVVAVPETWLFRYPRSFDVLVEALRNRLTTSRTRTLRMCSIGCATGQEAWCMAISALQAGWPADRVHVDGFDRNREFLDIAERGEYGAASVRTEIPAWAMPHLLPDGECIRIDPIVRGMMRFRLMDVTHADGWHGTEPYDVIFCRNVLIYLNAPTREQLLNSIIGGLLPGGTLFVGHAEQMVRSSRRPDALRAILTPHAFALERLDDEAAQPDRHPDIKVVAANRLGHTDKRPATVGRAAATHKGSPPGAPGLVVAPEKTLDDARAMADAGRTADVEPLVRSIMARRGPSAQAFELLGMIRMTENDADGARRLFEQAVYLEPTRSTSLLQLALISERAGDTVRASQFWARARRASSDAPQESRS